MHLSFLLHLVLGLYGVLCEDVTAKRHQLPCSETESDSRLHALFFFGTRPEIVKLAPVIQRFRQESESVRVTCVFTGQQPSLMEPFLQYWNVTPDVYIADTMQKGQSLSMLASKLLAGIDSAIELCDSGTSRQIWIVQGDTTSAYAAGTAAFYRGVPVAHVEAGLRTFDLQSPFPEEFNRRSLALIAAFHFAPTALSRGNLLRQGVDPERIFVTGNTGIDAVRLAQPTASPPYLTALVDSPFAVDTKINVSDLIEQGKKIVLLTMHRRENKHAMAALYRAISAVQCIKCVYVIPVHPNPTAREAATVACMADRRLLCVEPLPYDATQYLLANARFIMTDSGGLQEEATYYSKPVIVLRESTDRPEAVLAGQAVLAARLDAGDGFDLAALEAEMIPLLVHPNSGRYKAMSADGMPFGSGHASDMIVSTLLDPKNDHLFTKPLRMVDGGEGVWGRASDRSAPFCSFEGEQKIWNCVIKDSITVVLTIYKRDTLDTLLEAVAAQTMRPRHVYVVLNGDLLAGTVASLVRKFQSEHPAIPIDIVYFSSNSFFHGRFHIAYVMAKTEYVSVWDDDIRPGSEWLRGCVEQSKAHGDALIGGNALSIEYIMPKYAQSVPFAAVIAPIAGGRNDYVGLSWTLKREFLRYFLELSPFTYKTGDDMQLAFALQLHGIASRQAKTDGREMRISNIESFYDDEHAQHRTPSSVYVRQYLQCALMEAGFKPLKCLNCNPDTIRKCMAYFREKIMSAFSAEGFDENKLNETSVIEVFQSV